MEFKGSRTEKNLQEAFCIESKARNKYNYFASQAKKDGYERIARIFEETANNEKEHAKIWFNLLFGNKSENTSENLKDAAENEFYKWTKLYHKFAKEAEEEGFNAIAYLFEHVAKIEKMHHERFQKLYENVLSNTAFEKNEDIIQECSNCGYIHYSKDTPQKCPICKHSKAFFVKCENY